MTGTKCPTKALIEGPSSPLLASFPLLMLADNVEYRVDHKPRRKVMPKPFPRRTRDVGIRGAGVSEGPARCW